MTYKNQDLAGRSTRALKQRRRRLMGRLPEVSEVLHGSLATQGRRCGKPACRCARGQLHGPYTYLSVAGPGGRSRLVYVPAGLAEVVGRRVAATGQMQAVLGEISAINLELLARRELD
ncbi:MAG: DUF6788 family protein [Haloechinothrix sp.]